MAETMVPVLNLERFERLERMDNDSAHRSFNARSLVARVCDVSKDQMPAEKLHEVLSQIKEMGRNPQVANQLTAEDLESLVSRFCMRKSPSLKIYHEALTIVANTLTINPILFDDWDTDALHGKVVAELIQPDHAHDKPRLLYLRLLFLFTLRGFDLEEKRIKSTLSAVQVELSKFGTKVVKDRLILTESPILIEILKVTFNLAYQYPELCLPTLQGYTSTELARFLIVLVPQDGTPYRPTDSEWAVYKNICNCLICIPGQYWLYEYRAHKLLFSILSFLNYTLQPSRCPSQDEELAPILSFLHHTVSEAFSDMPKDENVAKNLKVILRVALLPSAVDRESKLGASNSLSGYLLRISMDPILRQSRDIVFDCLWRACDKSADKVVEYFGIGYASGFLTARRIAFPECLQQNNVCADATATAASRQVSRDSANHKGDNDQWLFSLCERMQSLGIISDKSTVDAVDRA